MYVCVYKYMVGGGYMVGDRASLSFKLMMK